MDNVHTNVQAIVNAQLVKGVLTKHVLKFVMETVTVFQEKYAEMKCAYQVVLLIPIVEYHKYVKQVNVYAAKDLLEHQKAVMI